MGPGVTSPWCQSPNRSHQQPSPLSRDNSSSPTPLPPHSPSPPLPPFHCRPIGVGVSPAFILLFPKKDPQETRVRLLILPGLPSAVSEPQNVLETARYRFCGHSPPPPKAPPSRTIHCVQSPTALMARCAPNCNVISVSCPSNLLLRKQQSKPEGIWGKLRRKQYVNTLIKPLRALCISSNELREGSIYTGIRVGWFIPARNISSCHAAVKKLFFYRFCMGRTSIVFRSKAILWGVSLLCF